MADKDASVSLVVAGLTCPEHGCEPCCKRRLVWHKHPELDDVPVYTRAALADWLESPAGDAAWKRAHLEWTHLDRPRALFAAELRG